MTSKVSSITVAFNPNPERLAEQVRALQGEVDDIVVVDNGSERSVAGLLHPGSTSLRVLTLPENGGVARGFNVGVAAARELLVLGRARGKLGQVGKQFQHMEHHEACARFLRERRGVLQGVFGAAREVHRAENAANRADLERDGVRRAGRHG